MNPNTNSTNSSVDLVIRLARSTVGGIAAIFILLPYSFPRFCQPHHLNPYKASKFYNDSVNTVKNHIDGICNYFDNRTTSGVMEGINNKIKLIKRQAYGFINFEHLRMRLIACFSN
ncbi:MAG: transposase [Thermosynechococcaceae cyanobacterium]